MASCVLDASETQAGTLRPANISEMETKKRNSSTKKGESLEANICHAENFFCFADCYFWIMYTASFSTF
jgi:hypothetical protein